MIFNAPLPQLGKEKAIAAREMIADRCECQLQGNLVGIAHFEPMAAMGRER